MYIKHELVDTCLTYVPDNIAWQFIYCPFGPGAYNDDSAICLKIGNENTITLIDADYYAQGRKKLPDYAVGNMFEEAVQIIFDKILNRQEQYIDIIAITDQLVLSKYKDIWKGAGYLEPGDDFEELLW